MALEQGLRQTKSRKIECLKKRRPGYVSVSLIRGLQRHSVQSQ